MIEERATDSAAEFWDLLSPEKPLFPKPTTLLYRGQADASWGLEPSIVRAPEKYFGVLGRADQTPSDFQVFKEWAYLKSFVDHCDSTGLRVPGDSPEFRRLFLDQNAPAGPGRAFLRPSLWPDVNLFELLALAQHHGVPTRLLDWSTRSHVAAYFAISDALQCPRGDRVAVWVLDITRKVHLKKLETVKVAGSNNANLAAQASLFTLLRQEGIRGQAFAGETALDRYLLSESWLAPTPLIKVTLPTSEAAAALALCELYGVTGATLFPDFYGAARAAKDMMRTAWKAIDAS